MLRLEGGNVTSLHEWLQWLAQAPARHRMTARPSIMQQQEPWR